MTMTFQRVFVRLNIVLSILVEDCLRVYEMLAQLGTLPLKAFQECVCRLSIHAFTEMLYQRWAAAKQF